MIKIGDTVELVDETGISHVALVTTLFTSGHPGDGVASPSLNVVFVSADEAKHDQYGRQIDRRTSVPHETNQHAPGLFWRELVLEPLTAEGE